MTDINKQIEEEAIKYANYTYGCDDDSKGILLNETLKDFKAGAEYILHASRWRKVSEELPKVASKPYCIVVRSDDGRVQLEWILEGYDECLISFLLDKCIEWKPIN